ncbi:unnamed protein product [Ilex paraguariensis]|uniref:Methyltransferase type 11 domain-containing protein n=1 Tax=Ilex paraguariensis TaxID=185542 RepID=A0ABC8U5V3_9AQUA
MDLKVLKWQILHGSLARRLLLKAFLFSLAMLIISFIQIAQEVRIIEQPRLNFDDCPLNVRSNAYVNLTGFFKPGSALAFPLFGASWLVPCKESENLTVEVFKELMEMDLLDSGAKVLCVGKGSAYDVLALRELGLFDAFGVDRHPFFSLFRKRFVYELDFKDDYFDFVFSRAVDRVSVPALLLLEIERVLRPGGAGAMLVGSRSFYTSNLIRSATPVSSFLKSSDVVHVCSIGSCTLVIFKKRLQSVTALEHFRLPQECPSVENNKPFMKYIEPLVDEKAGQLETELSYLPNFMNISSRNRLIYVNVGAGEFTNSTVAKMFKHYYPIHPKHSMFSSLIMTLLCSLLM